ncbi:RNA-binding ATPase activator esf2 [Lignoscripta atroalba]|nr:RNA-binding ATPase activator esf2 [Lignoscripta atroalba]
MATRKYNEYLDADLSDEGSDSAGYSGAEDARESRISRLSARNPKRRKFDISTNKEDEDSSSNGEEKEDTEPVPALKDAPTVSKSSTNNVQAATVTKNLQSSTKLKPLTPSQLAASQRAARKTGVIYLSRIPPFMRPQTVRHLLSPYGTVTRLFLTPEPPATYARRLASGGNKKRSFIDGWVEFASKKHAKICAEAINGQIIGGKKGGWYHDDIWNIKYLKGFKWDDLMAQVRDEEKVREGRLRAEIGKVGRERKEFLLNWERGKALEGMEEKRKNKAKNKEQSEPEKITEDGEGPEETTRIEMGKRKKGGFVRRFRQNEVKTRTAEEGATNGQASDVQRVLGKIF